MADFEVEVPIDIKGEAGPAGARTGAEKELKKLNQGVLKLNKTMILNIDVIEILSAFLSDLYRLLRPLFKILSIMLLLVFLPLMPIYKSLVKWLAKLAQFLGKITRPGGAMGLVMEKGKGYAAIIAGIFLAIGAAVLFAIGGWILVLLGLITAIIVVFWEDIAKLVVAIWNEIIVPAWQWFANIPHWIWETIIKPSWEFLKNVGLWIWERIIFPGWSFLKDVGSWIWDIISRPFRWLADKITSILGWFGSLLGGGKRRYQYGGMVPGPVGSPQLALVHGGEEIIPANRAGSKSITININNPVVRQSSDIKNIANEVSRVLQRQMSGRVSSGG